MDLHVIERFLMMATLINYGVLVVWTLLILFAKDWVREMHGHWFALSEENFNLAHYMLIGFYKLVILAFFLIPWITVASLT